MAKRAKVARAKPQVPPPAPPPTPAWAPRAWVAGTILVSAIFIGIALPVLGTLPHDFDEAWLVLDARFILRGLRPFVDFAHHEMPLHLYLLALSAKVFGQTLFGYRMVSLLSVVGTGCVLFFFLRPLVGPIPALVAQVVFLFSPIEPRALTAVPETPTVFFTLLGVLYLFTARDRWWSGYASGVIFVVALVIKPTSLVVIGAAVLSLAYAREWRRLRDLAVSGVLAAAAALALVIYVSDGVFLDVLAYEVSRMTTRSAGMWSVDSGFADMRRLGGIETPRQWAVVCFQTFYQTRQALLPVALFVTSLAAVPIWIFQCVRSRPALQAFVFLWPTSYLILNFLLVDFASPRYFIPFQAFSAFLLAGWIWLAQRYVPSSAVAVAATVACFTLVGNLALTLGSDRDDWYWGRLDWIAREYPTVVSFSPILFAATGTEPGCDFANPALTYGGFGEAVLVTDRTKGFRFSDERLIECLRANPRSQLVVDWAFYFFTRPGSALREYLGGEGSAQRLFFSPDALKQWDQPLLRMHPFR